MPSHTNLPSLGVLPATGYLRQSQIIPNLIPIHPATWWRWIAAGKAPKPVKLSRNVTAWRAEDLKAFMDAQVSA